MLGEPYLHLLLDLNHWAFEITVEIVVGLLIGKYLWGAIKRHIHRDDKSLEAKLQEYIDLKLEEQT